jgi:methionine biosynthesis protein MetW
MQKSSIIKMIIRLVGQPESYYKYKTVIPLIERNPDAVVLDCGCGDGEFTMHVAEKVGTRQILGIEIVEECLKQATNRGIQIYSVDLNKELPFQNETCDVVIANQIIEHLSNTDSFLKEIYRILKPGGYIIIATVNLASSLNILYLIFGRQPPSTHVSNEVVVGAPLVNSFGPAGKHINEGHSHVRVFTLVALKELLEYYRFKVEKSVAAGYYPFPKPFARLMSFIDRWHSAYITVKARKK